MKTIYTEVEINLDEFDDDELLDELDRRRGLNQQGNPSIQELYDAWVYKTSNYEEIFRRYCQATIGRSF